MRRLSFILFLLVSVLCLPAGQAGFLVSLSNAQETLTITTYYPSPYGSYNQLQTNSLGVGDNNNSGGLDSGDVPNPATNPGDVWIRGKVGIGTTNPATGLHVRRHSNILGYPAVSFSGITIQPEIGADNVGIVFYDVNNNERGGVGLGLAGANPWVTGGAAGDVVLRSGTGRVILATVSASNYLPRLTILNAGNVGIGTTGPGQKLDVAGNIALSTGGFIYGDTTTPYIWLNNSIGAILAYSTNFYVAGNGNLRMFTGNNERMRIDSIGNVGIGTANPNSTKGSGGYLDVKDVYLRDVNKWASQGGLPSITYQNCRWVDVYAKNCNGVPGCTFQGARLILNMPAPWVVAGANCNGPDYYDAIYVCQMVLQ